MIGSNWIAKRTFLYPGLAIAVWLQQGLIWLAISHTQGISWLTLLNHWDAEHYSIIATQGYQGPNWAFFPLYPLLVRWWALVTGLLAVPQVVGTLLSSLIFLGWLAVVVCLQSSQKNSEAIQAGLLPKTYWGWLLFLYSPGSFIFHSHHTESLFLLLSYLAFAAAVFQKPRVATILAGLAGLTRNQGFFVLLCVALIVATHPRDRRDQVRHFILICLGGIAIMLLFPLYQYWQTGNPWQSIQARSNWSHATSWFSMLQTLWFGNPWQNTKLGSLLHHAVYGLLIGGTVLLWRVSRPLALYTALSLGVILSGGELINTFRYGAVLFSVWFVLGDRLSQFPTWFKIISLTLMIVLNYSVTWSYALGRWSY
ncbi:hypothetical protein JOY44_15900 [Phormidium sp. CLA17]|uniref:hypothetical protein n=1 Tax=Leptolyngbya sp. Cla-17 TaxID=2803751 RepID=UPI001492C7D8|nr:hypothetical protein [Leptolyngbya sp. Cla-17]MBM0743072.1 hypothetical protein [Leptolyngbya sp. Cla-17]